MCPTVPRRLMAWQRYKRHSELRDTQHNKATRPTKWQNNEAHEVAKLWGSWSAMKLTASYQAYGVTTLQGQWRSTRPLKSYKVHGELRVDKTTKPTVSYEAPQRAIRPTETHETHCRLMDGDQIYEVTAVRSIIASSTRLWPPDSRIYNGQMYEPKPARPTRLEWQCHSSGIHTARTIYEVKPSSLIHSGLIHSGQISKVRSTIARS